LDKYLNKSKMVYARFIDLRKAFDSVLHPALLFKLVEAGVGNCKNFSSLEFKIELKSLDRQLVIVMPL
jgi:hypothetical protein